ncbi:MAG: hypothetical protein V2A74_14780, partial [bacterium]
APKFAYHAVARAFAPVSLSLVEKDQALEVWLVVQSDSRVDDEVTLFSGSVSGESLRAVRTAQVKAGDAVAKRLFRVPLSLSEEDCRNIYYFAALKKNARVRSEVYLLRPPKWINWSEGRITVREISTERSSATTFAFHSTSLVKGLWLRGPEDAPHTEFSDNAITLIPGIEQRVSARFPEDARSESPLRVWTYHPMSVEYAAARAE